MVNWNLLEGFFMGEFCPFQDKLITILLLVVNDSCFFLIIVLRFPYKIIITIDFLSNFDLFPSPDGEQAGLRMR